MKNPHNLECLSCGHTLYRSTAAMLKVYANGEDIPCPKCKSFSLEPIVVVSESFSDMHAKAFGGAL